VLSEWFHLSSVGIYQGVTHRIAFYHMVKKTTHKQCLNFWMLWTVQP